MAVGCPKATCCNDIFFQTSQPSCRGPTNTHAHTHIYIYIYIHIYTHMRTRIWTLELIQNPSGVWEVHIAHPLTELVPEGIQSSPRGCPDSKVAESLDNGAPLGCSCSSTPNSACHLAARVEQETETQAESMKNPEKDNSKTSSLSG